MKLQKCNDHQEVPAFSEEDLLRAENEFLRDELEFREQEYTLELYETILDCIQKEGSVSTSLEVMFGENVSSISNFESEINAQYESALEGFLKTFINEKSEFIRDGVANKAFAMADYKLKELKKNINQAHSFPYKVRFPKINSFDVIRAKIESIVSAKSIDEVKEIAKEIEEVRKSGNFSLTNIIEINNQGELTQFINDCLEIIDESASSSGFRAFSEAQHHLYQLLEKEDEPILKVLDRFINTFRRTKMFAVGRAAEDLRKLLVKDMEDNKSSEPTERKGYSEQGTKFDPASWSK